MAVDNPRGEMITISNLSSGMAGSGGKKRKGGTARQRKMMALQNDANKTQAKFETLAERVYINWMQTIAKP